MEPYDDSQPFPPEWEGEKQPEMPEQLMQLLRMLGSLGNPDVLVQQTREEWRKILAKFAMLANMGIAGFERTTNGEDTYDKGFHGMARWNMDKSVIENAGLTVEEVAEVWNIHMQELNDFFNAIKNQNIDKGLASDGEHNS